MAIDNFTKFARLVEQKFSKMSDSATLFQVDLDPETIWKTYLESFPDGANPIFKERTEHDCNCCRQFVTRIGSVVALDSKGNASTVWGVKNAPQQYEHVAEALNELILNAPIKAVYCTDQGKYGSRETRSLNEVGDVIKWNHYEGTVPRAYVTQDVGAARGASVNNFGVLKRGLEELSIDSIDTVIELVTGDETSIYRASEHMHALRGFRELAKAYSKLKTAQAKERFCWYNHGHKYALFRNTVIGTLIQDLSGGVDIETAVRSFESKVAPANYKRTSSLITKGMIDQAMKKIDELGIRTSLDRRHATLADVSVNDILFVDRASKPMMKDALLDSLMEEASKSKKKVKPDSNMIEIGADTFLAQILPEAESVEVLFEHRLQSNLACITAAVDADAPPLFSWGNNFSWSYNGNNADSSITQRVKSAGGNIDAILRVSLGWFNTDDLDLHVIEPDGNEIYYGRKVGWRSDGKLDVDMNVAKPVRDAVENVFWNRPLAGKYTVNVNNFTRREAADTGFSIELYAANGATKYSSRTSPRDRSHMTAITFTSDGKGNVSDIRLGQGIQGGELSTEVWGLQTGQFVKVDTVMLSPNHWGDQPHGNRHLFFIVDKCATPDPVRGMFNENLRGELAQNRKVFEVLASKFMIQPSSKQLGGFGFSSTKKNNVVVRVRGGVNATYNVQF